MIILEGPDGSGKTTLAHKLVELFDLEYKRYEKLSSTTGPDGPGIIEWWDDQISRDRRDAIYDRCFYVSEPIYQLVTPDRVLIADPAQMNWGIRRLTNFSPMMIFCIPPWEVCIANVGQRERLAGVNDEALRKVHWVYGVYYTMWSEMLYHKVMLYDYTRDREALLIEQVGDHLGRMPRELA